MRNISLHLRMSFCCPVSHHNTLSNDFVSDQCPRPKPISSIIYRLYHLYAFLKSNHWLQPVACVETTQVRRLSRELLEYNFFSISNQVQLNPGQSLLTSDVSNKTGDGGGFPARDPGTEDLRGNSPPSPVSCLMMRCALSPQALGIKQ